MNKDKSCDTWDDTCQNSDPKIAKILAKKYCKPIFCDKQNNVVNCPAVCDPKCSPLP